MMINKLIRQIKIDLVLNNPNDIIEWFNGIWSKIHLIETDVYHKDMNELIYYIIIDGKKQWIFYQDRKNERFWCNYNNYWSIISTRFYCEYDAIQAITKVLVENALNNSVSTLKLELSSMTSMVENALNNTNHIVISTPRNEGLDFYNSVENALNNSLSTPVQSLNTQDRIIDNVLSNIKNNE